jgi:carbon-monoxide dehydrogenase large subunit
MAAPTSFPAVDADGLARREDRRLLTGRGLYVHDVVRAGMLHAAFVRSVEARATIGPPALAAALEVPGVVAAFDGSATAGLGTGAPNPLLPIVDAPPCPLLALDRVDYVGQPVAVVVARSAAAAREGAACVEVAYSATNAATDREPEGEPAARVRHVSGDADAARIAATTVALRHVQARVVALTMEPRAAVAEWDPSAGTLHAWVGTQTPSRARADVARVLGLPPDRVRVTAPDVGGAFGAKSSLGPEELVVAWLARELRGCVKWTATRSEEFTSGAHGRGATLEGELSLDRQGRFAALRARLRFPLGAWLPFSGIVPARNAARILPGPYRVAHVDVDARADRSNAAPVTIYRGAGRPEAALLMERLVERAARHAGIDPVELRLRNLVPPDALPWTLPSGEVLDSGDYPAALRHATDAFAYADERAAQAARRAAGEVVGIGVAVYVEPCGQGWESARVTLGADGSVHVASGSSAQGQGHETSYAAIAADALGCDPARVTVVHGDTALCPEGIGALASRSIAIGGSAVALAALDAAARRDAGEPLPLTVERRYTAPAEAWSYGCVIARVAIDRDTGALAVERVVWADDAGRVVSPKLVEGQLLGGLAQGLGQALMERVVYDDGGQLLTGSLMDYAAPRAADVPPVELVSLSTPTPANALGARGVGEAGCIGVPAALLNSAADALAPFGEPDLDFPLTPERLWRAMNEPTTGSPR